MKVKHNDPDLLIVEERPWVLGVILGGGALVLFWVGMVRLIALELAGFAYIAMGLFLLLFLYLFVRRVQVVFHRPEGWVEIRQRTLTRYDRIRHDLAEIERAMVQTSNSGDGGPTHRVALVIPEGQSKGKHPLTSYYAGGSGADSATKAINGWLDSARTRA
ncbi:MAG: hypothetical protein WBN04_14565 [Paracoccaceae bacterium]